MTAEERAVLRELAEATDAFLTAETLVLTNGYAARMAAARERLERAAEAAWRALGGRRF